MSRSQLQRQAPASQCEWGAADEDGRVGGVELSATALRQRGAGRTRLHQNDSGGGSEDKRRQRGGGGDSGGGAGDGGAERGSAGLAGGALGAEGEQGLAK